MSSYDVSSAERSPLSKCSRFHHQDASSIGYFNPICPHEIAKSHSNKSEVIKNAVMSLFRENTELNVAVAIELYKKGEVSLSKAAEIAGVTTIEFKEILGKRGFLREIEARPAEEMEAKLRKYL